MNKEQFLRELEDRIAVLPAFEREKSLAYYEEMLDDMVEAGLSEEEAVAQLGPLEDVAEQIMLDAPLGALVKARRKPRHTMRAWEIVLLMLGSVVWVPLLLALVSVGVAAVIMILALFVSAVAVVAGLGVAAVGIVVSLVLCMVKAVKLSAASVAVAVGASLILAGLTLLGCLGVAGLGRLLARCFAQMLRKIKGLLIRKEVSGDEK